MRLEDKVDKVKVKKAKIQQCAYDCPCFQLREWIKKKIDPLLFDYDRINFKPYRDVHWKFSTNTCNNKKNCIALLCFAFASLLSSFILPPPFIIYMCSLCIPFLTEIPFIESHVHKFQITNNDNETTFEC